MRLRVQSLALLSGLGIQRCCELWCRPVATARIQSLAWEPPYAVGAALEEEKRRKKKVNKTEVGDKEIICIPAWVDLLQSKVDIRI